MQVQTKFSSFYKWNKKSNPQLVEEQGKYWVEDPINNIRLPRVDSIEECRLLWEGMVESYHNGKQHKYQESQD